MTADDPAIRIIKMKGSRLVYLLCGGFEAARLVFLYFWFNLFPGEMFEGFGNLTFMILGLPAFLFLFQFFLLAWDPIGNSAMTKALVPVKLSLLVPDFLLLILSRDSAAGLWLWVVTFIDISVLWLVISLHFMVKKPIQEEP